MYLMQRIEEFTIKYSDARKSIGEFLLKEKDYISKYSMQEIAELTFTSKTTLFRYAQSLGYSGWKEFILDFIQEVHYEVTHYSEIDPNIPFSKNDDTRSMIDKITKIQVESLEETAK